MAAGLHVLVECFMVPHVFLFIIFIFPYREASDGFAGVVFVETAPVAGGIFVVTLRMCNGRGGAVCFIFPGLAALED